MTHPRIRGILRSTPIELNDEGDNGLTISKNSEEGVGAFGDFLSLDRSSFTMRDT